MTSLFITQLLNGLQLGVLLFLTGPRQLHARPALYGGLSLLLKPEGYRCLLDMLAALRLKRDGKEGSD